MLAKGGGVVGSTSGVDVEKLKQMQEELESN
jgi:hypothetical protein